MKSPFQWFLFPLIAVALATPSPAEEEPEVREFRSKSGSRLKAIIVGVDPSGKVLLQRYAPTAVPLNSLSEEDQAFVEAWKERQAKEQKWIQNGELDEHYADPGISLLKGTLRTLENGNWKPYEPENVENLQLVAYYFSKEHPDDGFIHDLSRSYEKMRRRTDAVEVVYITLGTSDQAVRDYVKEKKLAFPVLDPASIGLINNSVVASLYKGAYPQMVVLDRSAAVKADSFRGNGETPKLGDTLDQLEDLVREAGRKKPSPDN